MAIRVLIERTVEGGQELKLQQILTDLRTKAMQVKGYISGETLRDINDPNRFLVISTWNTLADWKAWENDPNRKKLRDELTVLLRASENTRVFGNL